MDQRVEEPPRESDLPVFAWHEALHVEVVDHAVPRRRDGVVQHLVTPENVSTQSRPFKCVPIQVCVHLIWVHGRSTKII